MNIFTIQSEPGSAAFGTELSAAYTNGFEYIQCTDTKEVCYITEHDNMLGATPLSPACVLEVLDANYPDGVPDSVLSDEVKLFLVAETNPVEPTTISSWQSNINFNTANEVLERQFHTQAFAAYSLGYTHIISADGRYYKITSSDGDIVNLTDAEMQSLGLPLPKPPITEADAIADLAGEPRPDNSSTDAVEPVDPTPTYLEMGADIATKIDGIILDRLNTDKLIDNESANVLLKLNQISLSRRV